MIKKRALFICTLAAFLLQIAPMPLAAQTAPKVTVAEIEAAQTVKTLTGLGAKKLSAAEFKARIVGKPLKGDGWSWVIDADGTTSSKATDGSWVETAQPWHMKGDAYCTPISGKMTCRDVYMIGKYFRMSKPGDAKSLASWTAKVP